MRIPARFAPLLFSALLSAIMVGIVSAFVLGLSQGIHPGFGTQWLRSCATTWLTRPWPGQPQPNRPFLVRLACTPASSPPPPVPRA